MIWIISDFNYYMKLPRLYHSFHVLLESHARETHAKHQTKNKKDKEREKETKESEPAGVCGSADSLTRAPSSGRRTRAARVHSRVPCPYQHTRTCVGHWLRLVCTKKGSAWRSSCSSCSSSCFSCFSCFFFLLPVLPSLCSLVFSRPSVSLCEQQDSLPEQ